MTFLTPSRPCGADASCREASSTALPSVPPRSRSTGTWRSTLALLAVSLAALAGCASNARPPTASTEPEIAPTAGACPKGVPEDARCYHGRDTAGAYYWIAIPANWNQVLVMHAHGGPELEAPSLKRATEDLARWSVTVRAGYAWAGSTYRRGGYGVTMAAEDTERLRALFVRRFGQPRRTILHGQSYGGGVASKGAELFTKAGRGPYDAVLLTSGVLGGGTHAYDYRLDLRVVYQAVCRNHPLPTEPAYPLWQGLPAGGTLTRAELAKRVDACTGVRHPAAQRTPEQQRNLETIIRVIRIPERTLVANLNWATWLFADVVHERLDGRNPFGNLGVRYTGSPDDAALNAQVARYAADPVAVRRLADDADPTGDLRLPTLTLHAIDDPTAFVELESRYHQIRERAGTADWLVQTFSREHEHSYLADPEYAALFASLMEWVDQGRKPSPESVAARCRQMEARFGPGCAFDTAYVPRPLDTRVPAREHPMR